MRNFFLIPLTFIFAPIFYIRILFNRLSKNKQLKILVIATGKIGDLVCATPVFREIKQKFPDSYLVAGIREQSYGVVQNNSNIDKFIFINSRKYQGFLGKIKLIRGIGKEKFNWSINLSPHAFNIILPFWAGVVKRITSVSKFTGKTAKLFSLFGNYRLEYKQHKSKLRHNLDLLKFLDIKEFSEKKDLFATRKEEAKVKEFFKKNKLREKDFLVGITVTAGNKLKEWEPIKFSQLADRLITELGAKIIFIGAKSDVQIIRKIISDIKNEAIPATDFKLHELAALLKRLKLFISVDTGPLYIAHAVRTPVVDIAGPVDINEQPPRDEISEIVQKDIYCVPCSFVIPPARNCKEGHRRCIEEIMVDDVFKVVRKLFKRIYV